MEVECDETLTAPDGTTLDLIGTDEVVDQEFAVPIFWFYNVPLLIDVEHVQTFGYYDADGSVWVVACGDEYRVAS